MIPLTVHADLATAPIPTGPLLLDAILLAGLGASVGSQAPGGWAALEEVMAHPLPLARIDTPHGWWYAASQCTPHGPERQGHQHRRPPLEQYERWTTSRSYNHAAGPDKALRVPYYTRPHMRHLTWTAVGDLAEVARLLARVPSVGARTTHGHGWVQRWRVEPGGPALEDYRRDLGLRHLPVEAVEAPDGWAAVRRIPLQPPYHRRGNGVPCWQVTEVRDV